MFPPARSFVLGPNNWYSRTHLSAIAATVGSVYSGDYPLSNLVDGRAGPVCRFATLSAGVRLTFDAEYEFNFLGLFNHNLDPQLLIEVRADGVLLPRTFGVQYPHCWVDLRGFGDDPTNAEGGLLATTLEIRVYGNSRPVAFSELAAGAAYTFNGTIEVPYHSTFLSAQSRNYTEHQKTLSWASGVVTRTQRLQLQVSAAEYAQLETVHAWAGESASKVIVVPSTRINDIWLVHWPTVLAGVHTLSDLQLAVSLDLAEEAGGLTN